MCNLHRRSRSTCARFSPHQYPQCLSALSYTYHLVVGLQFSPKGGPAGLIGTFEEVGKVQLIKFPDGNAWTKVPGGTPERRPQNLKTLSTD